MRIRFGPSASRQKNERGRLRPLVVFVTVCMVGLAMGHPVQAGRQTVQESQGEKHNPIRLSLDEALGVFLKNNFQLLVTKYGIQSAKAQQVTAGLFPNPELTVGLFSSFTQGCNTARCGGVMPQVSQLLLIAGKRGYRIEGASLGTAGAEAEFEDAVRQLSFAVKDTYFRVKVIREHLEVDQRIKTRILNLIQETSSDHTAPISERKRIRLELLGVKAEREVIKDIRELGEVSLDLRILLGLPPEPPIRAHHSIGLPAY